jgi:hypothetical protein
MDPQAPPTAPSSATYAPHYQHHAKRSVPGNLVHTCYENGAYPPQQEPPSQRGSRGSRSSNGCIHDSVISQPFSPKPSSPPSQRSSVSWAAQKHRSTQEVQQAIVNVSYPPQAHFDPEKAPASPHGVRSPNRSSASNPDVTAVIYNSGDYQDKGPEEKPLQLLVCSQGLGYVVESSLTCSSSICPVPARFSPS